MSQTWPTRPAGADPVLLVDATASSEAVTLTRMTPGVRLIVQRRDSASANQVTVTAPSPLTLDGVAGGSITLASDSELRLDVVDGGYQSFGQSGPQAAAAVAQTVAATAVAAEAAARDTAISTAIAAERTTERARQNAAYARMAGPLGGWKAKLATDPANAKIALVGGSSSDPRTNAGNIMARLMALHTQQGEALYGVAPADFFTDGVATSGSPTFTSATANFTSSDVGRQIHGRSIPPGTVINAVVNSTTVTMSNNGLNSLSGRQFWVGRHIIGGGNSGKGLAEWFASPSSTDWPYNRDKLVADNPDLIIYNWPPNDIRQGALGTTVPACTAAGIALLTQLIDWTRSALPNADILMRVPNPFLSADVSGNHFVTDGTNINPAGLAQIYSTAMRNMHLWFQGRYPNVDVLDLQELFGSQSLSSSPLMLDQLHPSARTTTDVSQTLVMGGGYVAIADAIAERIGVARTAFPAATAFRRDLIVQDGGSAYIQLTARDRRGNFGATAAQAPVWTTDTLYVSGFDSPIALTSATLARPYSTTTDIRITGLTGLDFSGYLGRAAVITGSHPQETSGDRQIVSVNLPNVPAGQTITYVVSAVSGVSSGDDQRGGGTVACSPPTAFIDSGLLLIGCHPAATGTVRLIVSNPTGADIDLAAANWAFYIIR